MDNKEIQRQRMMGYFISAAKEIIKEEGVKAVSARKVGERAGYSYATIYNYFTDIRALLFYCALDYLEDCYHHLLNFKDQGEDCRQQVMIYGIEYFNFFVQQPELFQLIFLEDLGPPPQELIGDAMKPSVSLLLRETIEACGEKGLIPVENIGILGDLIASSIHGKLLFFLKRRHFEELNEVIESVRREIEFLIRK